MKEKTKKGIRLLSLFTPIIVSVLVLLKMDEQYDVSYRFAWIFAFIVSIVSLSSMFLADILLWTKPKEKKYITSSKGKIEIEN